MNVAAIIVTKGDQDLTPIAASIPEEWDVVIWDNSTEPNDLAVYGRYAAIERTEAELIYTQDDDCVLSDPQALLDAYFIISQCPEHGEMRYGQVQGHWGWICEENHANDSGRFSPDAVVCNMPPEFRHDFYEEHALVGFGACFHRDAPQQAWRRFRGGHDETAEWVDFNMEMFHRTCDIVFTALTPRVLVDVPVENLPWAYHWDRMYRQPELLAERVRMLDLVREIA